MRIDFRSKKDRVNASPDGSEISVFHPPLIRIFIFRNGFYCPRKEEKKRSFIQIGPCKPLKIASQDKNVWWALGIKWRRPLAPTDPKCRLFSRFRSKFAIVSLDHGMKRTVVDPPDPDRSIFQVLVICAIWLLQWYIWVTERGELPWFSPKRPV